MLVDFLFQFPGLMPKMCYFHLMTDLGLPQQFQGICDSKILKMSLLRPSYQQDSKWYSTEHLFNMKGELLLRNSNFVSSDHAL